MKTVGKIIVGIGCVAAVGALACYGLKKLMEKANAQCKCCDCGDECACGCECECHEECAETVDVEESAETSEATEA